VFTTTGKTKISGFSRAKRRLDAEMLHAKRKEARLNLAPHLVDHSGGAIRGVAVIYNRFEDLEERRAALEAWGRYVSNLAIATPAPAR
jgi:hypothetical protein